MAVSKKIAKFKRHNNLAYQDSTQETKVVNRYKRFMYDNKFAEKMAKIILSQSVYEQWRSENR